MNDMILILNYSNEFSLETAKRLRAEQIYSRIISGAVEACQIRELQPRGLILSGESFAASGTFDVHILELGIPVLALGHASRLLLAAEGGASVDVAIKDKKVNIEYGDSPIFMNVTGSERYLKETMTLMLPPNVEEIARAGGCTIAFQNAEKRQYGLQFELERNDPDGSAILKNFARDICGCNPWWTEEAITQETEHILSDAAARGGFAVCAVSGGLNSLVAASLTHRAFGMRMTAVFVDTGLMRRGEKEQIQDTCAKMGIPLLIGNRSAEVLNALRGKIGASEKLKVVMGCLREEIMRQAEAVSEADTLVLGTYYGDLLLRGSQPNPLWRTTDIAVIEPLSDLFKDEVRMIARRLGFSDDIVERKPFPILGLAARILGEVTEERLYALRVADSIFDEELRSAGQERKLYKYFPVLASSDMTRGKEVVILRAVTTSGGMLMPARLPYDVVERTATRILSEAPVVARVLYDTTPTAMGSETFS